MPTVLQSKVTVSPHTVVICVAVTRKTTIYTLVFSPLAANAVLVPILIKALRLRTVAITNDKALLIFVFTI